MDYHTHLKIDQSPHRGRGVFAKVKLDYGLVCDQTYSWTLTPEDLVEYDKTTISGFWFHHPDKAGWGLVPLGLAALINHSTVPNAALNWSLTPVGYVGLLTCLKVIEVDEELFIDYGIGTQEGWI